MKSEKLVLENGVLGREWHADRFVAGADPRFAVVFFGGSGVSEAEYLHRRESVPPAIADAVLQLETEQRSFLLVHVTAPFDLPFARFDEDRESLAIWQRHVREEILPLAQGLPFTLGAHSGGAVLALAGPAQDAGCFGACFLGADALPGSLERSARWRGPLRLVYNLQDSVYDENRGRLQKLTDDGIAEVFRTLPGGHALSDYVGNQSFHGIVRWAEREYRGASAGRAG